MTTAKQYSLVYLLAFVIYTIILVYSAFRRLDISTGMITEMILYTGYLLASLTLFFHLYTREKPELQTFAVSFRIPIISTLSAILISYFYIVFVRDIAIQLTTIQVIALLIPSLCLFTFLFHLLLEKLSLSFPLNFTDWSIYTVEIISFLLIIYLIGFKPNLWNWISGPDDTLAFPFLPPLGLLVFYFSLGGLIDSILIQSKLLTFSHFWITLTLTFCLALFFLVWGLIKTPHALPLRYESCLAITQHRLLDTLPPTCVVPDGRSVVMPE